MGKMTEKGISTTEGRGVENYQEYDGPGIKPQRRVQYDYRHLDGVLFSTDCPTLEGCREQRDAWLRGRVERGELKPIEAIVPRDLNQEKPQGKRPKRLTKQERERIQDIAMEKVEFTFQDAGVRTASVGAEIDAKGNGYVYIAVKNTDISYKLSVTYYPVGGYLRVLYAEKMASVELLDRNDTLANVLHFLAYEDQER